MQRKYFVFFLFDANNSIKPNVSVLIGSQSWTKTKTKTKTKKITANNILK